MASTSPNSQAPWRNKTEASTHDKAKAKMNQELRFSDE
jgi:hypothetical protein